MRTALIVDDEIETSRALARVLRIRGWEADIVTTAAEAREFVRSRPALDAIIVDVVGPERPGVDLAADFAKVMPRALVVVTSGYSPAVLATIGITINPARFLAKPYDAAQLDALFGPRI